MHTYLRFGSPLAVIVLILSAVGCSTPKGETASEKRADVQSMKAEALDIFRAKVPGAQAKLDKAVGYGAFSGVSTQTLIMSSGNGYGVIHENATGNETYMRAFKLGGGLGAGVQGLHAVVIFHDAEVMNDVLADGWGVSGRADAAARIDETGDAAAVVITLPGMSIYRFTKNGVMLGGAIEGTKVWPDKELN